jgi:hypothetical protein
LSIVLAFAVTTGGGFNAALRELLQFLHQLVMFLAFFDSHRFRAAGHLLSKRSETLHDASTSLIFFLRKPEGNRAIGNVS